MAERALICGAWVWVPHSRRRDSRWWSSAQSSSVKAPLSGSRADFARSASCAGCNTNACSGMGRNGYAKNVCAGRSTKPSGLMHSETGTLAARRGLQGGADSLMISARSARAAGATAMASWPGASLGWALSARERVHRARVMGIGPASTSPPIFLRHGAVRSTAGCRRGGAGRLRGGDGDHDPSVPHPWGAGSELLRCEPACRDARPLVDAHHQRAPHCSAADGSASGGRARPWLHRHPSLRRAGLLDRGRRRAPAKHAAPCG
jgi:hypothetical protein